jgi:hypothetical protein
MDSLPITLKRYAGDVNLAQTLMRLWSQDVSSIETSKVPKYRTRQLRRGNPITPGYPKTVMALAMP